MKHLCTLNFVFSIWRNLLVFKGLVTLFVMYILLQSCTIKLILKLKYKCGKQTANIQISFTHFYRQKVNINGTNKQKIFLVNI